MAKNKAPAVVSKWTRMMVVGCSHGHLIDPAARENVLHFKKQFKPQEVIHLGDFLDLSAFRSGAKGSSDESTPIKPDMQSGLDFIEELACSLVFCGNHEHRLWKLRHHYSAIVSELSAGLVNDIEKLCKKLRAELVEYHVLNGWRRRGDFTFGHGYFFNQMAARDHAEAVGNVVFAHTHTCYDQRGRRLDNPRGICVGTLSDIPNMEYACQRRQTMAWSQGFVWGERNEKECQLWLHDNGRSGSWKLPA